MDSPYTRRATWSVRICLALYFGLLLLYLCKTVIFPMDGRQPNMTMWAIHTLPLLIFLPGMLRSNQRTYAWLSFVLLFYFVVSVEGLFSPVASPYHSGALALIVLLFCACVAFIRWIGLGYKWREAAAEQEGLS